LYLSWSPEDPARIPVLLTSSFTSTVDEEMAGLLLALLARQGWTDTVDEFILLTALPGLLLLDTLPKDSLVLVALACNLDLDSCVQCRESDVGHQWSWSRRYYMASHVARALQDRSVTLPQVLREAVYWKVQEISADDESVDHEHENNLCVPQRAR